jgi:hypothetical protein
VPGEVRAACPADTARVRLTPETRGRAELRGLQAELMASRADLAMRLDQCQHERMATLRDLGALDSRLADLQRDLHHAEAELAAIPRTGPGEPAARRGSVLAARGAGPPPGAPAPRGAGRPPGAPRAPADRLLDAEGHDLRPDPLTAATPAEFTAALRVLRLWSGNRSFRQLAARSGGQAAYTTIRAALSRDTLPRYDVLLAILAGCGASTEEGREFATAWRRLAGLSAVRTAAGAPALHAVPPAIRSAG